MSPPPAPLIRTAWIQWLCCPDYRRSAAHCRPPTSSALNRPTWRRGSACLIRCAQLCPWPAPPYENCWPPALGPQVMNSGPIEMCLGIPGQVVEVLTEYGGELAMVDVQGAQRRINLGLLEPDEDPPAPGDWV